MMRETATARIALDEKGVLIVRLRVARPGIPTHLFTNEARAFEWLAGYVE